MREGIHPNYVACRVVCACGHSFVTRSTLAHMHLEICSNCHPYYTGKQKLVDSAGRVERFTKRFEKTGGKTLRVKAKTKAAKPEITKSTRKILSTSAAKTKTGKKSTSEK